MFRIAQHRHFFTGANTNLSPRRFVVTRVFRILDLMPAEILVQIPLLDTQISNTIHSPVA
jgi:hypothetical protein